MDSDYVLQIILRNGSAITLTLATFIIGFLLYKNKLTHPIIWKYVVVVIGILSLWRWFIVLLLVDEISNASSAIIPWIQPITQAFYLLLGVIFIILALSYRRGDTHG